MNWRNVRLIFLREVRDQLRDRRTLFMIAVLPLLLYPCLGVGMVQMAATFTEQPRTVVVLGASELPPPPLLDGDRFAADWFDAPSEADRLRVVTEDSLDRAEPDEHARLAGLLEAAKEVREAHRNYEDRDAEYERAKKAGDAREAARLLVRRDIAARRRSDLLAGSGVQVLVVVPDGLREKLAEANARLRDRDAAAAEIDVPAPAILYNPADEKSLVAYGRVKQVYDAWGERVLRDRLRAANLPETLPNQIDAETVDLARDDERAASLWSKLFPALLVLMTVTGAFYPAVDLAAGEKERGTMETLLICPASRAEIVLGKFFTVMLFSVATALLNLASMGLTGRYMASFAGGGLAKVGALAPPPLTALFWVAVLLLPLAALFSALCLSLATFARSSKEGQYYLTPLLLVTIGLTVFCLSPAVEITPLYSVMPVVGGALLLKELLAAGGAGYAYIVPVLVTSLGYAGIALWWAIEQFKREDVLFREAERFELGLWLRHVLRDKDDAPSFAEAGFCFMLIMLLQFVAMKFLRDALVGVTPDAMGTQMLKLLMVQQLAIIATPALLMGVMLTRSVRRTFRLRRPDGRFLAAAALLPVTLQPVCYELVKSLRWFLGDLPPDIARTVALMGEGEVPLWLTLLAFAVAPALCEEIAFRGFILSGFLRSRKTWLAVGLSSLCFGVMHMIPQQVFNATLVGLVLGLLAVRSGSLWPGVLFHLVFNGQQVLLSRVSEATWTSGRWDWLVGVEKGSLSYSWPVLVVGFLASAALIAWLFKAEPGRERRKPDRRTPAERRLAELTAEVG